MVNQEDIKKKVNSKIEDNDVVIFMKGNRLVPRCMYSKKAIDIISQYETEFECVDILSDTEKYRQALNDISEWKTVPQIYVNEEFIGGSDIIEELDEKDELQEILDFEDNSED